MLGLLRLTVCLTAIALAACGGDDGDARTAPGAASAKARPAAVSLDRFLMRRDEEPGFRPGAAPGAFPRTGDTITGVEAFAEEMGLAPAEAQRLRREGFISFAVEPIRGPRTAGLSNVALYETAAGARQSLEYELRPDIIRRFHPVEDLRWFKVPGVPGARGWSASEPHVGNVFWVQGRCMLVLGNQGPGPFAGPLSAGARAIYERTDGECP